jgi:hypothetical protein
MNEFIDFLTTLVLAYIAIRVIAWIGAELWLRSLESELDKHQKLLKQLSEASDTLLTRVEQNNGVFFLYRLEDSEFVAQGTSLENIRENLQAKYRQLNIKIVDGDKEVLQTLKGQS